MALQKDTLETLDICLPVYGPAVAREHARKMWNCLKLEVRADEFVGVIPRWKVNFVPDLPTNG